MFLRFELLTPLLIFLSTVLSANESFDSIHFDLIIDSINLLNGNTEYEQAIQYALESIEEGPLSCSQKLDIYRKIGVSYYLGDAFDDALRYWKDSIPNSWPNCPVSVDKKIKVYSNISAVYEYIEDNESFFKYFEKVLELNETLDVIDTFTTVQNHIRAGTYFSGIQDYKKADLYFSQAETFTLDINDVSTSKLLHNRWGISKLTEKDFDKAIQYLTNALKSEEALKRAPDENTASIYHNLSIANLRLNRFKNARRFLNQSKTLNRKNPSSKAYTNNLDLEAEILLIEAPDSKRLELIYKEIIEKRKITSDEKYLAIAYSNLAEFYIKSNQLTQAEESLNTGLAALRSKDRLVSLSNLSLSTSTLPYKEELLRILNLAIRIKDDQYLQTQNDQYLLEALILVEKLDTIVNRIRLGIDTEQSALRNLESNYEIYENAIKISQDLSSARKDVEIAKMSYELASRNKAIIMRQNVAQQNLRNEFFSKEDIERKEVIENELVKLGIDISMANEETDSLEKAYLQKQEELELFNIELKEKYPRYFDLSNRLTINVKVNDLQKHLHDNQAIVEFFAGKENLYSFVIMKNKFAYFADSSSPQKEENLANMISLLRENGDSEASSKLYDALMPKVDKLLSEEGISRLIIAPDGMITSCPFEALRDTEGQMILEKYAISYSYSVSSLLDETPSSSSSAKQNYIAYGTNYTAALSSKLKEEFPNLRIDNIGRLSNSVNEITKLHEELGGTIYTQNQASLTQFRQRNQDSKILHLALHGVLASGLQSNSAMIFDDESEDYILNAAEIYQMNIPTELMILSVCHSAEGRVYKGEGVQSLSRAFYAAGCPAIVSSLWTASEYPAAQILDHFVTHLKQGVSTDIALQKAKLTYLKNSKPSLQNPNFWANLILIGEAEKIDLKRRISYKKWILMIAGFSFLSIIVYFL